MEWISVKDRLPENLDEVVIYVSDYGIDIAFYSNQSFFDYNSDGILSVTHWMPLPKPPKIES
jgi:hypothetical protein